MADPIRNEKTDDRAADFTRQAEGPSQGLIREFFGFMRHNKKWWLTPILVALLGIGVLILVGGSAAAPFLYTLF
jgi:Family of unknown function (DUF5989)